VISEDPIIIGKIIFVPHAVTDSFQLDSFEPSRVKYGNYQITYSIATSTDDTITSTGNFASTWAVGYVVKCIRTTGSDTGVLGIIKTAGDNDKIVITLSPFSAENNKVGDFEAYVNRREIYMEAGPHNTALAPIVLDFGTEGGKMLRNLALPTLSAECKVIIHKYEE
jgi:hypothetical protein